MIQRCFTLLSAVALLATCQLASAATITIQMNGVDAIYDGTNFQDANLSGADSLDTVTVKLDGVNATGSPFVTDVDIDFFVPSLLNIPVAGGSVTSAANGTLEIGLPGSDYLSLTLSEVEVQYTKISSLASFAFLATVGEVSGQSLPDGLMLGDPVEVTLTTILSGTTNDGTYLTSFNANGPGAISGPQVPEPTSIAMVLGLALVGAGVLRNRR